MSDKQIQIEFISQERVDSQAKLSSFIANEQQLLGTFYESGSIPFQWDSTHWPVKKGVPGRKDLVINFNRLSPDILPFVKAFIFNLYRHKKSITGFTIFITLFCYLDEVLLKLHRIIDLTLISPDVLNEITRFIRLKHKSPSNYGQRLQQISDFFLTNELTEGGYSWKQPFLHDSTYMATGKDGRNYRKKRNPDTESIRAIGRAYFLAETFPDKFFTAVASLLLFTPGRVSELFVLPRNPLVEETDERGSRLLFRWWPKKGAPPQLKEVPKAIADVARSAVTRLQELTEPYRKLAKWYEDNPGKLWLPPEWEYLRERPDDLIRATQIQDLLPVNEIGKWLKKYNIPYHKTSESRRCYRFMVKWSEIEEPIRKKLLPEHFPYYDSNHTQKISESLLVVGFLQLEGKASYIEPILAPAIISVPMVSAALGNVKGKQSIFDHLGLKKSNGDRIVIRTHQIRHWLNTEAKLGGLNAFEITNWSGRKSVQQTQAYIHTTDEEMRLLVSEKLETQSKKEFSINTPVEYEDFEQLYSPTIHETRMGFCTKDWGQMTCTRFKDCANCNEHCYVKGIIKKYKYLSNHLSILEKKVHDAEQEVKDGNINADRWLVHNRKTLSNLRQVKGIMDDPECPDGTLIKLNLRDNSPIMQAMNQLLERKDSLPPNEQKMLQQLKTIYDEENQKGEKTS